MESLHGLLDADVNTCARLSAPRPLPVWSRHYKGALRLDTADYCKVQASQLLLLTQHTLVGARQCWSECVHS